MLTFTLLSDKTTDFKHNILIIHPREVMLMAASLAFGYLLIANPTFRPFDNHLPCMKATLERMGCNASKFPSSLAWKLITP